jgi:molecular chaperone GrpE
VSSTSSGGSPAEQSAGERIVIRDKRKINPSGVQPGQRVASPSGATMSDQKPTPNGEVDQPTEAADAAQPTASQQPAAEPTATADEPKPEPDDVPAAADEPVEQPASELVEVVEGDVVESVEAEVIDVEPVTHAKPAESAALSDDAAFLQIALAERTADLQRITAEYANYRKRVDRDRTRSAEQAIGTVLSALLPVLDDLDRAREHGDLTGPFAAVADQLNTAVGKFGLVAFGAKGDPFDPNLHEAVAHLPSADVTEPTCIDVMRRGYLLGERVLRPAMVAVAGPE